MGYGLSPHEPSVKEGLTGCTCGWYTNVKPLFLVFLVIALVILSVMLVRLRHPRLTVISLERFIEDLQQSFMYTWEEGRIPSDAEVDCLFGSLRRIKKDCEDIVKQKNGNVFRWSLLHHYMMTSFNILRNVLKCSDEAEILEVQIKNYCIAVTVLDLRPQNQTILQRGTGSGSSPSVTTSATGIELRSNTQAAAGTGSGGIGNRGPTGTQARV
ncbi:hypothetical protein D9758_000929 [Tetrapyrgos nigripes]|uniref:Uncharacterized protein n=1 Tax=Tetrapyrgos nigripes TaxID=182062 RepID=A0A8H5GYH5_9AGAR|nr:hypothetical protein D9758_000929 [Tetrapyrgos nigripes]